MVLLFGALWESDALCSEKVHHFSCISGYFTVCTSIGCLLTDLPENYLAGSVDQNEKYRKNRFGSSSCRYDAI